MFSCWFSISVVSTEAPEAQHDPSSNSRWINQEQIYIKTFVEILVLGYVTLESSFTGLFSLSFILFSLFTISSSFHKDYNDPLKAQFICLISGTSSLICIYVAPPLSWIGTKHTVNVVMIAPARQIEEWKMFETLIGESFVLMKLHPVKWVIGI